MQPSPHNVSSAVEKNAVCDLKCIYLFEICIITQEIDNDSKRTNKNADDSSNRRTKPLTQYQKLKHMAKTSKYTSVNLVQRSFETSKPAKVDNRRR